MFNEHFYLPLYLPLCVDLMLCIGLQGPGLDAEQHLLPTRHCLCRGPLHRKEVLPSANYCMYIKNLPVNGNTPVDHAYCKKAWGEVPPPPPNKRHPKLQLIYVPVIIRKRSLFILEMKVYNHF